MLKAIYNWITKAPTDQPKSDYADWWYSPQVVEAHLSNIQTLARDAMAVM